MTLRNGFIAVSLPNYNHLVDFSIFFVVLAESLCCWFVQVHLAPGSQFNFQKYIKRSLEDDFKLVVGVR